MSSSLITRPLSLGELLDVTFRVYRKHFWRLVLTAGGLIIPIQIIGGLLNAWNYAHYAVFPTLFQNGGAGISPQTPAWLAFLQIVVGLLSGFLTIVTSAAVLWLANRLLLGEAPGVIDSWRAGLRYFWRYMGLTILLGLMMLLVMLALSIALIIPCLGVLILLAGLVIVFYGFVRLVLSIVILFADDVGPIDAIKRAWHVSRNQFWRIAIYGLLLWLLALVFYLGPILFIQSQLLRPDAIEYIALLSFIITIVAAILNTLWTPLYMTGLTALYHELRLRTDPGKLLENRIAEFEAQTAISEPTEETTAATEE